MDLVWLGWALVTTAVWGIGTLTSKPATDGKGARFMLLGAAATEAVAFGVLGLLLPRNEFPQDGGLIAVGFAAGAAGMLGYAMFYEGLRLGEVGVVGTVTAAYPVVTVLLGVLLLQESLTFAQAAGVALVIACILLLAIEPRAAGRPSRAVLALSVLGFLAWGVWGYLAKTAVDGMGEANLFLLYAAANAAVGTAYFAVRRGGRSTGPGSGKALRLALVTLACGAAGVFSLTLAYANGPASLVTPVTGAYPIVSTLGAAALLKEAFSARIVGALVCFGAGIALISIV